MATCFGYVPKGGGYMRTADRKDSLRWHGWKDSKMIILTVRKVHICDIEATF